MKKKIGIILVLVLALTLFAACSLDKTYTVTFDTQGGSTVASQNVKSGEKITKFTVEPTKSGKEFVGWSKNSSTYDAFDFETEITADTTVYAIWKDSAPLTAKQVFENALAKMEQQDYINIFAIYDNNEFIYHNAFTFEKGMMKGEYYSKTKNDILQYEEWITKEGKFTKEFEEYYKVKLTNNDLYGLSLNLNGFIYGSNSILGFAYSYSFNSANNIIIATKDYYLKDIEVKVVIEDGLIKSIGDVDTENETNFTYTKNSKYYVPDGFPFYVDIFWYRQDDIYLAGVRNEVNKIFKDTGFKVRHYFARNDEDVLYDLVYESINNGADMLIVNPVDGGNTALANQLVDMARKADIPIVFFNKEVGDDVLKAYDKSLYIGTVPKQAGEKQGELIADFLKKPGNIDKYKSGVKDGDMDVIYYAMLRGCEGHMDSDTRTYYSVTVANELLASSNVVLKPSPLMDAIGTPSKAVGLPDDAQTTNADILKYIITAGDKWDGEIAAANFAAKFSSSLGDTSKLGIIISNNDGMALSVVNYLKTKGYNLANADENYDASKYIPIVGVDGNTANLELIKAGSMTGTAYQSTLAYAELMLLLSYEYSNQPLKAEELRNTEGFVKDGYIYIEARQKIFFNYGIIIG